MNISPVSFRNTVGTPQRTEFNALISRPQAYAHMEQPTAATNLEGGKKKKSPIKTILGLIIAAGGIMAGLALGAEHGVFNAKSGGNKYVEIAKSGLKIAGEKCSEWGKKAIEFGKNKFNEIKSKLSESTLKDILKKPTQTTPVNTEAEKEIEKVVESVVKTAAENL